jgi:CheY-like chemotaxis protein
MHVDNLNAVQPPHVPNEEKDYVFLKRLEAIYIDDDISAQKLITKAIGDTIHITACDSIYTAVDNIASKNYDIILCDMMASPDALKDFFNKFSQKIPIVAISSSLDPKFAYAAARMGAKDYINKNQEDLKSISKSLHKVYLNWIKDREKKNSMQLLNDPNIRIVLKDLISTELPITQRIRTYFTTDMQINDTIKNTYNIQANDILAENQHILKSLIKMEFLVKESVGQTLACPNCKSVNIFAHYFCDNCKNSNFKSKEALIHNHCNSIITEKKVHRNGQLLCPHCNIFFENNISEYHTINGYQCNTCNNIFIQPSIFYSCNNCNLDNFSINEGNWIELVRYNLQQENLNKIKKNIFLLMNLEQFLKDMGFIIKQYEKFVIEDRSFGPFELIASKNRELLLFIILSNDLQYNLSRIFEMDFASRITDKDIKSFAVAFFEPQEIVLRLLSKFGIIPLVKENTIDIVKEIEKQIQDNKFPNY